MLRPVNSHRCRSDSMNRAAQSMRGLLRRSPVMLAREAYQLGASPGSPGSHVVRLKSLSATSTTTVKQSLQGCRGDKLSEWKSQLQLYNSMARCKQRFTTRPGHDNRVEMYVCGVTVYDYSHIGHARVYIAFDILYRLLLFLGFEVNYVRNFTDIDDKIIKRAEESKEDPLTLSQRFIKEFHVDMERLGCLPPSIEPKATEFIPAMVDTIQKIIDNGHAYAVSGDVFFDVESLPGYGRLSGRAQEDNRAGERVAVDGRKRNPADFALWKSCKPGEPSWDSPWGPGRPGWHIECSSMIRSVMGSVIDIHGGGRDLIFPHHENELAQSQAAVCECDRPVLHKGTDFVRYWLHNGFVNVDSEKMSKSLGNFFTIRDVVAQYHPLALRLFLVSTQYRQPVNYTQRALDEASDRLYYIIQSLLDVGAELAAAGAAGTAAEQLSAEAFADGAGSAHDLLATVVHSLLDDLSTPQAISTLSAPLKQMNDLLSTKAGRRQKDRLNVMADLSLAIQQVLQLLGLDPPDLAKTLVELRTLALQRACMTEEEVTGRIEERATARKAKDFAAADKIRLELAGKGILIMDLPAGTTWRPGAVAENAERN